MFLEKMLLLKIDQAISQGILWLWLSLLVFWRSMDECFIYKLGHLQAATLMKMPENFFSKFFSKIFYRVFAQNNPNFLAMLKWNELVLFLLWNIGKLRNQW